MDEQLQDQEAPQEITCSGGIRISLGAAPCRPEDSEGDGNDRDRAGA